MNGKLCAAVELAGRAHNRPRRAQLEAGLLVTNSDKVDLAKLQKEKKKQYQELTERIERCEQICKLLSLLSMFGFYCAGRINCRKYPRS